MKTYTIRIRREGQSEEKLTGQNRAQVGGQIGHAIDEAESILIYDEESGKMIGQFDRDGLN